MQTFLFHNMMSSKHTAQLCGFNVKPTTCVTTPNITGACPSS